MDHSRTQSTPSKNLRKRGSSQPQPQTQQEPQFAYVHKAVWNSNAEVIGKCLARLYSLHGVDSKDLLIPFAVSLMDNPINQAILLQLLTDEAVISWLCIKKSQNSGGPSAPSHGSVMEAQLAAAKVVATALCKWSGLVGELCAPSLMIGAVVGVVFCGSIAELINSAILGNAAIAQQQAYALD
ncbi:Chloride channel protein CLC-f [Camellia lanceoleosa]|uniref:Chloride channel protein CLC-f n=1 Tax=Camellia lanceoleosa TaxID=1840588 RepID=A0ACC0G904_9ERIC|nr:Chloride channel protein CLC-f [Camellia lanceoleosa]